MEYNEIIEAADKPTPIRLNKDPIFEATFEIQFIGKRNVPVSDLLPGILYSQLKGEMPVINPLFPSELPKEVIKNDPQLKGKPTHRIEGNQYSIGVGGEVFGFSCKRPYVGWDIFKRKILKMTKLLEKTGLVDTVTRFSLKYINIIPESILDNSYSAFDSSLTLGIFDLTKYRSQIKTELVKGDFVTILQVIPDVTVKQHGVDEKIQGTLLDIDTIYRGNTSNFWKQIDELVEDARQTEKSIFFAVISDPALKAFDPEWS